MTREQLERLLHDGPQSFEDAKAVRDRFVEAASRCLQATTNDNELMQWIAELNKWARLLPWAALHIRHKVRMMAYEMPETIVVELPPK